MLRRLMWFRFKKQGTYGTVKTVPCEKAIPDAKSGTT
jgi:hypothetical protein